MQRLLLIVLLIWISCNLFAENGLTNYLEDNNSVIGSYAKPYVSTDHQAVSQNTPTGISRENWVLIDSLQLDAFIQPGDHFGAAFDPLNCEIEMISNFLYDLVPMAADALQRTPKWLQPALRNTLLQIDETTQNDIAQVISNAPDPYVDEIAFAIAHSSAEFLSSEFCNYGIFTENAALIYLADQNLDYVEIVDYGTSITDENYYSTTRYWKIDANGNAVQFEIPKEIYYMYIVHPKVTDEISAYIDPEIIENNATHQNNIVDPPIGQFWREFLFYEADDTYPILQQELAGTTVFWDETGNSTSDAIHKITGWINASMSFTSNAERPHQPVRIYRKHIGRCGEYADLTSAVTRAALIPCTSVLSYSGDHTWNEFWNEDWTQWEPVNGYYNVPLVYENGWGKVFGSVFEIRSNGLLSPVTDRYSEGIATITIYAEDVNGNPIDGARIILKTGNPGLVYDNFGYTDEEGKYVFIVGEGRSYYARMDSEIGNDPLDPDEYSILVDNSVNGENYEFVFTAQDEMPALEFIGFAAPEDTIDDYLITYEFETLQQVIHGKFIFDDIDDTFFFAAKPGGKGNFFMTDDFYFSMYEIGSSFITFNELTQLQNGFVTFQVPVEECWFGFWDNGFALNNPIQISGMVRFFEYDETSAGNELPETEVFALSIYPNPFNPNTTISFNLTAEDAKVAKIEIYNLKGQKVKTLVNESLSAGRHSIVWNGMNDRNQSVSSGVYFVKLISGKNEISRKVLLMK